MPRVLNKHKDVIPSDAIYIGRPSKWGNPFPMGAESRSSVLAKYRYWLNETPDGKRIKEQAKKELKGKDLVCYCKPLPCHGDLLLKVANDE